MSFVVYSKGEGCIYCKRAKELLKRTNHTFREEIIGIHILREEFLNRFPDRKTVPVILHEGKMVGGYNELVTYLGKIGPAPELLEG